MEYPSIMNQWFKEQEQSLIDVSSYIFNHPESAYQEVLSSRHLASYLESQGFQLQWNIAGLSTAFIATWGSGSPILGFLAEYDALPGLGQQASPTSNPLEGAGHGCGHNLLGTAVVAAACGLKAQAIADKRACTIRVYGCPAEEILSGKIKMNEANAFHDLDVAITWHPFDRNRVSNDIWLSQDIKYYHFHGKTAHAAKNPELGRSALDAAELMNIGVNYLREHVPTDVRMHYAYIEATQPANVVPDYVKTNYFIRSPKRQTTVETSRRVDACAKGAALMTGTTVDIELVTCCSEMKVNRPLMEAFYKAMESVPLPIYTKEDINFAKRISKEASLQNENILFGGLEPLEDSPALLSLGTDVADVSHVIPTITLSGATMCKGTPLHHWSTTAQAGMSIGQKGMLYIAKCMALGAYALLDDSSYIEAAWKEHLSD